MGITCSLCMKEEESIHLTDTTCHHCNTVFMDQESLWGRIQRGNLTVSNCWISSGD